ncbi:alpha/beta-hydrolase [Fomitiporia mediterranea MF3/22]|uniref:alpha/beta-hydrolase n=1 Tax=Fomitiporia mediterranea (strain MF3/22) TaxID=694068 RepID=UPI00044090F2|nr:alpha/beta-hydrolase [Fomitiporia mediterranea MF3/22]EJD07741.1 alpha/beta-hydrolase [Fomitiporia mediterranea MF3/22]
MSGYIPSLESVAKGTFASVAGFSTLSLGLLYYGQNYLIYPSSFPPGSRTEVSVPSAFGLPYEELALETPDRVKVRAYVLVQRKDLAQGESVVLQGKGSSGMSDDEYAATRPTIVMFHGNGGNFGHRIPLAKMFYVELRCNVFMLSYRGYGLSEGSPSEKGIRMDAQTSLDYLTTHPVLSKTKIVLYGQSIGGAVAIDLASRNPSKIHALILENTFLSLPRLIPTAMPLLSRVAFLCHQKWDTASKVPLIPSQTPILLLSGAKDEVVPRAHMVELERLVRGDPEKRGHGFGLKRPGQIVEFPEGAHNDTCIQRGYWNAVATFIDRYC